MCPTDQVSSNPSLKGYLVVNIMAINVVEFSFYEYAYNSCSLQLLVIAVIRYLELFLFPILQIPEAECGF
jgi:hypothetical protein